MTVKNVLNLNEYITKDEKLHSTYRLVPIQFLKRFRAIMKSKGFKASDYDIRFRGARLRSWDISTRKANAHSFDVYCKGMVQYHGREFKMTITPLKGQ